MSSNITEPSDPKKAESGVDNTTQINASPLNKGKAKAKDLKKDPNTEEEDNDDDEEDMGSEEEGTDEEVEDNLDEIDPTAIVGRRTRGVKVDYTSKEALEKAGLQGNEKDEDTDEDVEMKDA